MVFSGRKSDRSGWLILHEGMGLADGVSGTSDRIRDASRIRGIALFGEDQFPAAGDSQTVLMPGVLDADLACAPEQGLAFDLHRQRIGGIRSWGDHGMDPLTDDSKQMIMIRI